MPGLQSDDASLAAVVALAVVLSATPGLAAATATPSSASTSGDLATPPSPAVDDRSTPPVRLAAVYPNPAADGDRGEFVLLSVSRPANLSGVVLDDGEGTVRLHGHAQGRVAVTEHPGVVRDLANGSWLSVDRVLAVEDLPALSNAGERVAVRNGNDTLDTLQYGDAPERSLYAGDWRHLDATDRPIARFGARSVRAFVLPDDPAVPLELLRDADRRVLLAGYTFESERVVRALEAAVRRGVSVRVLVDAGPVGGVSRRQVRLLDRLSAAGVDVSVYGADGAPHAYHHAKYAVVDDRAMVTTENWEPGGLGGHGNRGWGAVVSGPDVAAELAAVFRADAAPPAAVGWPDHRESVDPVYGSPDRGSYPSRVETHRLQAESVRLLVAPDNAREALVDLLEGADDSIRVQQVSMEHGPLLSAVVDAARRGVEVRILLSGAEYVREENRRLARALNDRADRRGWDLRVRVADPDPDGFESIHTKGAIVDDSVVVGSLNWNDHSAGRNREVVLVLGGEAVAEYYRRAFATDWDRSPAVPTWLVLAAVAAGLLAAAVGYRRVSFGRERA